MTKKQIMARQNCPSKSSCLHGFQTNNLIVQCKSLPFYICNWYITILEGWQLQPHMNCGIKDWVLKDWTINSQLVFFIVFHLMESLKHKILCKSLKNLPSGLNAYTTLFSINLAIKICVCSFVQTHKDTSVCCIVFEGSDKLAYIIYLVFLIVVMNY